MAAPYKLGTAIDFDVVFTDANGNQYDPDINTVKIRVKKPDGTVYAGWDWTDNKYLTKVAVGDYQVSFQTLATDPVGYWVFEFSGSSGPYTSRSDLKLSLRV